MTDATTPQKTPRSSPFAGVRPSAIRIDRDGIVAFAALSSSGTLPMVASPTVPGVDIVAWFADHRDELRTQLTAHGALLFRGFGLSSAEDFRRLCEVATPDLLQYRERSTPRSTVQGNIYTSTEYPAEQHIPLHNENAYSHLWPGRVWFFCRQAAIEGGETPLADSREVYRRIDPDVIERFVRKGVMYVRNYREGIDLDWRTAFQTDDRAHVEAYCRQHGITFEWIRPEHLRTSQVRQAIARHPLTGDTVWFNQAHLFHVSALQPEVAASLLALHGEADLPRNACYGDGSPIEPEALAHIHDVYRAAEVCFPWQNGDALLVDNLLVAHGRRPFVGPRSVLVAMADPSTAP